MKTRAASGQATLFTLTLFLSAALLFLVQPMFGKMVLPRFGGAPAVWNTCLVFFQAALLAGYSYAHVVSTRLDVRLQVVLHVAVLLTPLISLPIAAKAGWEPAGDASPIPSLLGLLAVSVGLPFVVVSTSAPLLQAWFARSGNAASGDPYFLYAASNAGSLLALLAYPLLLEPALPLSVHGWIWTGGYVLLVCLVLACGISIFRSSAANPTSPPSLTPSYPHTPTPTRAQPTALTRLHWLALAFVPSSLMLSVTLHLTTDVAAVPLLWVIPLALYLTTFVLVFARRQLVPQEVAARVMPGVMLALAVVLISEATEPIWILMLVHWGAFFVAALVCHGELARLRPPAEQLTEFYLWLSIGGVLGGLFSALVAPFLFRTVAEYPLMLVAACLLRPAPAGEVSDQRKSAVKRLKKREAKMSEAEATAKGPGLAFFERLSAWQLDLLLPIGLGLLTAALVWTAVLARLNDPLGLAVGFAVPAVICYLFLYRPVRFALGMGALLLAAAQLRPSTHGHVLHVERSFFGVHRVTVDPTGHFMQLVHGNTVHGKQHLAEKIDFSRPHAPLSRAEPGPARPLNYYYRTGPIGDVFPLPQLSQERLPIAVIGLGTGSLAAYAEPGQTLDFYEIDPVVKRIAEDGRYFTFLRECRGLYRIILGDARLKIGDAADGRYGLIVVDAFSSDAVPLHLITREAVELYTRKLADRGLIAFHVSNRYLDLPPVLSKLAVELDLVCLVRSDLDLLKSEFEDGKDGSIWVVLSRRNEDLGELARNSQWTAIPQGRGAAWTDDRANIFSAWKWWNPGPGTGNVQRPAF